MRIIKKHKLLFVALFGITVAYFLIRLLNLTALPIFTDEAIYLWWAKTGLHDPYYRFIALTDGKGPIFTWIMYPFLKLFHDPLIAGRIMSVICGFFTLTGIGFISFELFKSKRVTILTLLLYIVFPFAQVYDRLAIYDGMVAAFFIWAVYLSIKLVRKNSLSIAYTLSFVIAGGLLTKPMALFNILLFPLTLIIYPFKTKVWVKFIIKWTMLAAFASFVSYAIYYTVVHLSPVGNVIGQKTDDFIYSPMEWITHPFLTVIPNSISMLGWLIGYMTIPVVLLVLLGLLSKITKEKLLLFFYFFLPFTAIMFFGKLLYPRYLFFISILLLPLAALGIVFLFSKIEIYFKKQSFFLKPMLVVLCLIYPFYVSLSLIFQPLASPIPDADKSQYIIGWPAGWGLSESVSFFQKQAEKGPLYIATEGTFGLLPYGLNIYLNSYKNITIKGYFWEIKDGKLPGSVIAAAKKEPVYFIFYQPCLSAEGCRVSGNAPYGWPVKLLSSYEQGTSGSFYRVYQVIPQ